MRQCYRRPSLREIGSSIPPSQPSFTASFATTRDKNGASRQFARAFFSPTSILTFSQFSFGGSGQVAKSVNAQGGL
jgi:hypothetical protein